MDLDTYLEANAIYSLEFDITFVDGDSMTIESKEEAKGRVTALISHYHERYRALQNQPPPQLELIPPCTSFSVREGLYHLPGLTAMLLHSKDYLYKFTFLCGEDAPALRANNAAELTSFLEALQQQSKLEKILYNFSGHTENEEPTYQGMEVTANAIIMAASKLPALIVFMIFLLEERLSLDSSFSALLQNNSILRILSATFTLNEAKAFVVSNYLQSPACILQQLCLCLPGHSALLALVEGLRLTRTLERLELEFDEDAPLYDTSDKQLRDTIITLAGALEGNSSLLHLILDEGIHDIDDEAFIYYDIPGDDGKADAALTKLLTVNRNIRNIQIRLRLDVGTTERRFRRNPPVVDMYCRFNANGRKKLLQNIGTMSFSDWINTLAGHNEDHSWLFYVLKLKPSLWCSTGSTKNMLRNLGKRSREA